MIVRLPSGWFLSATTSGCSWPSGVGSLMLARFGFGQGVAADDNWLDDDFDA